GERRAYAASPSFEPADVAQIRPGTGSTATACSRRRAGSVPDRARDGRLLPKRPGRAASHRPAPTSVSRREFEVCPPGRASSGRVFLSPKQADLWKHLRALVARRRFRLMEYGSREVLVGWPKMPRASGRCLATRCESTGGSRLIRASTRRWLHMARTSIV